MEINNEKTIKFLTKLLELPLISDLGKIEDLGVAVTTHTYDVLEIATRELKKNYKTLEEANQKLDLFAILIGVLIHDSSKVSIRSGDEVLSHSQVMLKKPDRIKKEAQEILFHLEEETNLKVKKEIVQKIVHIVLSHHGRWGSVRPSSKEALVVHKADEYSAKYHRINPIGADKILELMAKGMTLDEIMEELNVTSGIIKDRLKRAKIELKLKNNKQLLSYYKADKKIVIGDEFFIKRIKETKELIKKEKKVGFVQLVMKSELLDYIDDNNVFEELL